MTTSSEALNKYFEMQKAVNSANLVVTAKPEWNLYNHNPMTPQFNVAVVKAENGYIISIGSTIRVVSESQNLHEEIAALIASHTLNK